jgi:lantibiotic biosynthesis protein
VTLCERAAAAIAADLTALAATEQAPHPSLSSGAGWSLMLHHAGRRGLADPVVSERLARAVMTELPRQHMAAGLISGFTGAAWLRAHLEPASAASALRTIERRLVERLHRPWPREDDLLYGLVGFGAHFADRLPDPRAHEGLGLVVRRLHDFAERRDDGTITWVSRSRMWTDPDEPPRYDLGVAHGVPGTIAILAAAFAAGAEAALAQDLLDGAVPWVLGERRTPGWGAGYTYAGASLPFYIGGREDEFRPSRLGWCYGDASAALMLMHAAEALDREDWRASALDLARHAARRDPGSAGVVDAGLCHGSAGLALVFARLAAYEDDAELRAAASTWLGQTLEYWKPGRGCGGFTVQILKDWVADPSFLMGAAGIGLALLALSDPEPPAWDRLLLLTPPRG